MQNHIADSFVVSRQMRIATAFPEKVIKLLVIFEEYPIE